MPRWDLVYKWADPETRSLVDAVTSALENCDHKLTEAAATERRLTVERMAKDVEARIRSGAYLTYHAGPSNLVRDSADSILATADVDKEPKP